MQSTRSARAARWLGLVLVSAGLMAAGAAPSAPAWRPVSPRLASLPRITIWAWERREDLRGLDPTTTAVAYLDRTVMADSDGMRVLPRRQPLLLPASDRLTRIPVVRLETGPGAPGDDAAAELVAKSIVEAIPGSGAAALQVDFDARLSERAWYAGVLRRVRAQMPAGMPLSITALASWCSYDSAWLRDLPVDEAVPMLFRMEPERRRAARRLGVRGLDAIPDFAIHAPLCTSSAGISTTEPWPGHLAGKRVYIFPDRGWARDGLAETVRSLP